MGLRLVKRVWKSPIPARLRALAKPRDGLKFEAIPGDQKSQDNNPSARRARRLARQGWLTGWPIFGGRNDDHF